MDLGGGGLQWDKDSPRLPLLHPEPGGSGWSLLGCGHVKAVTTLALEASRPRTQNPEPPW